MYPNRPKRQQLARRFASYAAMVTTVLLLSVILFFVLLGYRYNSKGGNFEQGGLVQFITKPSGAKVTVGSAVLANRTRTKITLNPGSYLTTMELEGYVPWQKTISIKSGQVLWLSYARLVPISPVTKPVVTFEKVSSTAVDTDGKYYAILADATLPIVKIVRIDNNTNPSTDITLPSGIFHAGKKHTFQLLNWSKDGTYLLMKHTYDGTSEWIALNVGSPAKSQRIVNIGNVKVTKVLLDPQSDDNALMVYSDHTVRSENLSSGQTSDVLLSNIANVALEENNVFYSTVPVSNVVAIGYYTLGAKAPQTLTTVKTSQPIKLAANFYFNDVYLMTSLGKTATLYNFHQLPNSDGGVVTLPSAMKTIKLGALPFSLESHGDGRFLTVQYGTSLAVYDEELSKTSTTTIAGATTSLMQPVIWLDEFHFWNDANGSLRQYEFDGANQTDVVKVAKGFQASYSNDGKYMYSMTKVGTQYQLQQTSLTLN